MLVPFSPSQNLPPNLQPQNLPPAQPGQPAPTVKPSQENTNNPVTAPTSASDANTQPSPDGSVFRSTIRTVLVPTTIRDKKTLDFIDGLSIKDFSLYDNDHKQQIVSDFSYQPISVVVAIQANSEVTPMIPKLRKVGLLLHGLVTGEGGDMAVLKFDHRIQTLQDWTSNPDQIDDAMQKFTTGSSTARTIDAVVNADEMLKRHDPQNRRRRVIILFSQGYDKGSEAKTDETLRQMQFDSVIVYAVDISQITSLMQEGADRYPRPVMGGAPPEAMHSPTGNTMSQTDVIQNHPGGNVLNLAPPLWRSIKDLFKQPPDRAFATLTGGRVYTFAKQSTLERLMTDLGMELHNQYLLSYVPDKETTTEPGFHKIRVEVNHPNLEIRTRTGYYWGGGVQ